MPTPIWSCRVAILLSLAIPSAARAAENPATPAEAVAAIEAAFGVTPGQRRNHTKGTCAAGEFVGVPAVATYSRSPLFSGKPLPVVARFSLAGGNPKAPDTAKSARGMSLEFRLPDGSLQHMTMLNTPVFGAARPETFRDLMLALKPDPATGQPDPEKLKAFRASHPDSLAQAAFLSGRNPPSSYARSAFFGIHTFRFVNRNQQTTLVRWRFVPQDGEQPLTDAELKTMPADFLEADLLQRSRKRPQRWDFWLSIGRPGDTQDDPTVAWPEDRQQIKAGTLSISSATPQQGGACENINFDPLVMADGIVATDDPILRFRSPAYAVSFGRRLGGS